MSVVSADKDSLVSIVVPVYNSELFISKTINSVLNQTYSSIEIIAVNDNSTDSSLDILNDLKKKDKRVRIINNSHNLGAAKSRNIGVSRCKGRYLAFIDSDDIWINNKLKRQILFMEKNNCAFSFTGFDYGDLNGCPKNKNVKVPSILDYNQALKNTVILTSTVMFDLSKIKKKTIEMPNVGSEDTATWWHVLKSNHIAYGLDETLTIYRVGNKTLSSNKIVSAKRTWNLYRKNQKLPISKSMYCFVCYAYNATRRRL